MNRAPLQNPHGTLKIWHWRRDRRRDARRGNEPGVSFYTHISDQFGQFYTKVIAADTSEAAHVLDGLLYHDTGLAIEEHYTDRGAIDRRGRELFIPSATASGHAIARGAV